MAGEEVGRRSGLFLEAGEQDEREAGAVAAEQVELGEYVIDIAREDALDMVGWDDVVEER
jgi:hypothetical protein